MLSIGKLGIGHCAYYERSVADGAEDYYTGKGDEQGTYIGHGTEELGLDGVLAHGDLNDLMRGRTPDGARWHERQQQNKTATRKLRVRNGDVIEQKRAGTDSSVRPDILGTQVSVGAVGAVRRTRG